MCKNQREKSLIASTNYLNNIYFCITLFLGRDTENNTYTKDKQYRHTDNNIYTKDKQNRDTDNNTYTKYKQDRDTDNNTYVPKTNKTETQTTIHTPPQHTFFTNGIYFVQKN